MKTSFLESNKIPAFLLFVITFGVYANTLGHQFAFDDTGLILDNRFLSDGTSFREIFSTNYRFGMGFLNEGLYRPLTMLTYVFNNRQLNPFPFHLFNVLLNAINCVLVFFVLKRLTKSISVAFFSSLIFSLHPIHTEAVANIAGRPELLCAFFLFLSLLAYYSNNDTILIRIAWLSFFFLALLSKETAVVFPTILFTIDFFIGVLYTRNQLRKYVLVLTVLAIYLFLRWHILGDTASGKITEFIDNPIFNASLTVRISTALSVLVKYCILLIFPFSLSPDYSFAQIRPSETAFTLPALSGLLIITAITVLPIAYRKKTTIPGIAASLFLMPYILISNIFFPIGTIMGDRLMYLPSVGFALVCGMIFQYSLKIHPKFIYTVSIIALIAFASLTISHNNKWHNDMTLFSAAENTSPQSAKVMTNLGFLWSENGDKKKSEYYYRKALEIHPEYGDALSGLGKNLYDQKRFRESLSCYRTAIELFPNASDKYYDYGSVLEKTGNHSEAVYMLSRAVALSPANPLYHQALGTSQHNAGDTVHAIESYKKALSLNGEQQILLNNLAAIYFQSGLFDEALGCVKTAESKGIRLHPEMVAAIKGKHTSGH